ncbi:hypothetical protein PIB30_093864, partial [Stylosanthes scabra]|nr:hypothetical protein [Stylosanthes scabra]
MVKLFEFLGYTKYRRVFWEDKNAPEFETGLNMLRGDDGIRALIDYLRMNMVSEFHLYWDHVIDEPIFVDDAGGINDDNQGGLKGVNVEEANADNVQGAGGGVDGGNATPIPLDETSSSSDDGYESAEDEAYKPPPDWNAETGSDSDEENEALKKRNVSDPKKGVSPRKIIQQSKAKNVANKGKGIELGQNGSGKKMQGGIRTSSVGPSGKNGAGPSNVGGSSRPNEQPNSDSELDEEGGPTDGERARPKQRVYMPQ